VVAEVLDLLCMRDRTDHVDLESNSLMLIGSRFGVSELTARFGVWVFICRQRTALLRRLRHDVYWYTDMTFFYCCGEGQLRIKCLEFGIACTLTQGK
jgi:hypothetical protein